MVQRFYKQQELNLGFFFNGQRGLRVLKFLRKKLDIKYVFLAKKNLNKKIIKSIKGDYSIINTLKDPAIFKEINKRKINLIISAGFPYIFGDNFFNKKKKIDILNLHGGPLPRYRGGSPLVWQKIEGKKKIGISVIKANKFIDGGKLMGTKFFSIKDKDNIKDIHEKSEKLFCNLLWNVVQKYYLNKDMKIYNKKEFPAKYYFQRKPDNSLISLTTMDSKKINNFHKALIPLYEAPFLYFREKKVSLLKFKTTNIKSNFKIGSVEKIKNNYYLNLKDKKLKLLKISMDIKKINNKFLRSEKLSKVN
ncbi:formyltransferase family protein [Candidatus Pelagibacter sp.]|nr:formyltransferase family protein [Candidatus Pelagibacter sp.]